MSDSTIKPASTRESLATQNKNTIYLAVVIVLGITCVLTVVCSVILLLFGHEVPGQLWTISASSLSAIVGLLIPSPVNQALQKEDR